jgi:predicted RNA-binding protein with PUA-like domain
METRRWLVKQEPEAYAWEAFVRDGRTAWTGVRNFQARNFLRAMRTGDLVLYYHSVTGKQVVGVARVAREAYPDPTATEGDWSVVDLVPMKAMARPVALDVLKADPVTASMPLIRQSRLSVMPLTEPVFQRVLELGDTQVH